MSLSAFTLSVLRDQADLVATDPETATVEQIRAVATVARTLLDELAEPESHGTTTSSAC